MRRSEVCPFPFTQLFLNPNGKVTPCCYLAQDTWYVVGEAQKHSLAEMWNSEKMRVLRREFLKGKPKICEKYIRAHQCHKVRRKQMEELEVKPKEIMPFPMVRLDMMLNGQCNLECVMCGVWRLPNGVYGENGFWEQGKDIFPHIKEIDFKGGEPFIQKDLYRLIDEVSAVNPDCNWHLTTNGHYRFNEKLRKSVEKINIVRLSISIDSLDPENFSRIRKKGKLATVLKTLDDWIEQKENGAGRISQINCNFVVQKANWHEVPAFFKFCREKNVVPFFIILTNPAKFSPLQLPLEEKIEALNLYFDAMTEDKDEVYLRIIRPILETLPQDDQISILAKYIETFNEARTYGHSIAEVTQ